jgi:hypothetical protein
LTEYYQAWDFNLWQGQWSGMRWDPGYVVAAKDGVVVFAKDIAPDSEHCDGCANVVIIRHSPNEYSWYYHLQQGSIPQAIKEARQNGTSIEAGTVIGMEGNSGRSTNPHLHFMVTDGIPDLSQYDENDEDRAPWPQNNNFLVVDFEEWDEQNLTPFSANYLNPSGGVVLYWDADYKGPSAKFTPTNAGTETRLPDFLYHRVSSIRVTPEGEYFVALYSDIHSHPALGGYCRGWWWTEANFDNDYCDPKENPAPERLMNDAISSLKVTSKQSYCGYAAGVTGFLARASAVGISGEQEQFCEPAPSNDSATFLSDITLPDGSVVSPGQALVKTWRVRNSGTSTWDGYKLIFLQGDQMGGTSPVNIPTISPNQEVDLSVSLRAPTTTGNKVGYWQIVNRDGVHVPGGRLWVNINVVSSTSGDHIAAFNADPPSPSSASTVRLYARVNWWPQFRAMRVKVDNQVIGETAAAEYTFNWNAGSASRGDHTIVLEVADQTDTAWSRPERRVLIYTLQGTPGPANHAPDRPTLERPYNWYVTIGSPPQLCANPANDPDGDPVQYYFDTHASVGSGNSGWINDRCWTPPSSLPPGTYEWRVKARDNRGAESDWSDPWHYSVESTGVEINQLYFEPLDPNQEQVRIRACTTGHAGVNISLSVRVNTATDGSENGEWRIIKELGVPCFIDLRLAIVTSFV